jgi:transposase
MISKQQDGRRNAQIVGIDDMVPRDHLVRKIDRVIDEEEIYRIVAPYYCEDNGRKSIDPVVLVKMVMLQHIFGIMSLRQTVKRIETDVAFRWFLHFDLLTPVPHFATVSYNFAQRLPSEVCEQIFEMVLHGAAAKGYLKPEVLFIDGTHIKASANKNKASKEKIRQAAREYEKQLRAEINAERAKHGDKPFEYEDETEISVVKSTTDPDCGVYHKGEHERQMAYEAHTACDENGFVLATEVTAGNVHDSVAFDAIYEKTTEQFPQAETVVVDAGYKKARIAKRILDDGRIPSMPYTRPMGKKGGFTARDFTYDNAQNEIICPNGERLKYTTTSRDGYRQYKSDPDKCSRCSFRDKCTKSKNQQRVIIRHIWSGYIDVVNEIRLTSYGKETYGKRKETIERVFADAKEKHGMRYTNHRGKRAVTNWVLLKFACMNLKKMALWDWKWTNPCSHDPLTFCTFHRFISSLMISLKKNRVSLLKHGSLTV